MDTPNVTILSTDATETAGVASPSRKAGTVVDSLGRRIVCKLLSPLEQYRLSKIMGEAGESAWTRQIASNAATVREFEGDQEAFPNSDREIEALIQRLGDEGFEAVNEALKDLLDAKPKKPNKDAAKN